MIRVLPALVIGAVIAAGIIYIMAFLIGGEPIRPTASAPKKLDAVVAESYSSPEFRQMAECQRGEEDAIRLIEESKSCNVDSDCGLVSYGCPFGCVDAISIEQRPKVEVAIERLAHCNTCVYMCVAPMFEWQAVCLLGKCQVQDRRPRGLEQDSRKLIAN